MSKDRDIRVWKLYGAEDWVPPAKEGKNPEEQQKDEREEMKASATIMGSLSIKVQPQIPGDSPTPKRGTVHYIWDRLIKLYDQSTAGLRMQLKGELASFAM
ncbi:hypothetical protein POJ06DRAFT_280822 [Lipomyces tetrasporus]|uniref:Uncharacterized protein n=1 Tax=Lipomyces tetrasporus TaxID=54092 RepID=A0AAD7QVM7_9ASCO|nr:uncharacterized protein POJ06DRAFT_280822 [Lipomyces tetrasporus]KAJ8102342.1 hypothetical protein POJ06DRAFT_280822 [Lipomyces tetrasporus]